MSSSILWHFFRLGPPAHGRGNIPAAYPGGLSLRTFGVGGNEVTSCSDLGDELVRY